VIIDDVKKIALRYIKGWLILDILVISPIDDLLIWYFFKDSYGEFKYGER